ncbi:hypothetical protein GJ654_14520 [Rhodoblastus acidophilus]|uniref:Uncharacterized protein n=1 Tax=Rhodoblastus acidophilus TaxID=1074 RepID=A0A6N8DSP4_RHOAC|nr:hypothetical protein [Rhodoblastus acidophilus]
MKNPWTAPALRDARQGGLLRVRDTECSRAFSSEVDAGSREENASKQKSRAFSCFHET